MLKRYFILLLLNFLSGFVHVEARLLDDGSLNFKNETLESCFNISVSAAVQSCLGYVADEKEKNYEATFNNFIKDVTAIKSHFFDFNLFVKLLKKTKRVWDKNIKDECLTEATLDEKDGFTYHYSYRECLIKGYESRTKFYQDYRGKIPALEYYADEVAGKK